MRKPKLLQNHIEFVLEYYSELSQKPYSWFAQCQLIEYQYVLLLKYTAKVLIMPIIHG